MAEPQKKPRLTLTTQIFIGLLLGVGVGFLINRYYAIELGDPHGRGRSRAGSSRSARSS